MCYKADMKKNTLKYMAMALLLVAAFSMTACGSGSGADNERLAALEAEIKALRVDAQAREARFKDELVQIRKNLEGIRGLIQVEKGRADALAPQSEADSGDSLDQEIDKKAKSFVSENLDRLLDITKKLLDKMEQELDQQMKDVEPQPKGEEI